MQKKSAKRSAKRFAKKSAKKKFSKTLAKKKYRGGNIITFIFILLCMYSVVNSKLIKDINELKKQVQAVVDQTHRTGNEIRIEPAITETVKEIFSFVDKYPDTEKIAKRSGLMLYAEELMERDPTFDSKSAKKLINAMNKESTPAPKTMEDEIRDIFKTKVEYEGYKTSNTTPEEIKDLVKRQIRKTKTLTKEEKDKMIGKVDSVYANCIIINKNNEYTFKKSGGKKEIMSVFNGIDANPANPGIDENIGIDAKQGIDANPGIDAKLGIDENLGIDAINITVKECVGTPDDGIYISKYCFNVDGNSNFIELIDSVDELELEKFLGDNLVNLSEEKLINLAREHKIKLEIKGNNVTIENLNINFTN